MTAATTARKGSAFCSVEEAARFLGISRGLAYRLAREYLATGGKSGIPALRFGNRLVVPVAALERLAAGGWL